MMTPTVRCAWQVRAGPMPGSAAADLSRTWTLTVDEWGSPRGMELLVERAACATGYATYLHLLRGANWIEVTFVWM